MLESMNIESGAEEKEAKVYIQVVVCYRAKNKKFKGDHG